VDTSASGCKHLLIVSALSAAAAVIMLLTVMWLLLLVGAVSCGHLAESIVQCRPHLDNVRDLTLFGLIKTVSKFLCFFMFTSHHSPV